jgi:hypothetical protein
MTTLDAETSKQSVLWAKGFPLDKVLPAELSICTLSTVKRAEFDPMEKTWRGELMTLRLLKVPECLSLRN